MRPGRLPRALPALLVLLGGGPTGAAALDRRPGWSLPDVPGFDNGLLRLHLDLHNAQAVRDMGHCGTPDIVIAVYDVGWSNDNPDINYWVNPLESGPNSTNGIDDDGNGFIDDVHGCNVGFAANLGQPYPPASCIQVSSATGGLGTSQSHANMQGSSAAAACTTGSGLCSPAGGCVGGTDGVRLMTLNGDMDRMVDYAIRNGAQFLVGNIQPAIHSTGYEAALDRAEEAGLIVLGPTLGGAYTLAHQNTKRRWNYETFATLTGQGLYGRVQSTTAFGDTPGFAVATGHMGSRTDDTRKLPLGFTYSANIAPSFVMSMGAAFLSLAWAGDRSRSSRDLMACARKYAKPQRVTLKYNRALDRMHASYPALGDKHDRIARYGSLDVLATYYCMKSGEVVPDAPMRPLFREGLHIYFRHDRHFEDGLEWYIATPGAARADALHAHWEWVMTEPDPAALSSSSLHDPVYVRDLPLDACYDVVAVDERGSGFTAGHLRVARVQWADTDVIGTAYRNVVSETTVFELNATSGAFATWKATVCLGAAAASTTPPAPVRTLPPSGWTVPSMAPAPTCPSCSDPELECSSEFIGDGSCDSTVATHPFLYYHRLRDGCDMSCYAAYDASAATPCVLATDPHTQADGGDCVPDCATPPTYVGRAQIGDGVCDGHFRARMVDLSCYASADAAATTAPLEAHMPLDGGDCAAAVHTAPDDDRIIGVDRHLLGDRACDDDRLGGLGFDLSIHEEERVDCDRVRARRAAAGAPAGPLYAKETRTHTAAEVNAAYEKGGCCDDRAACNATLGGGAAAASPPYNGLELAWAYQGAACCGRADQDGCLVDVESKGDGNRVEDDAFGRGGVTMFGYSHSWADMYAVQEVATVGGRGTGLDVGRFRVRDVLEASTTRLRLFVEPVDPLYYAGASVSRYRWTALVEEDRWVDFFTRLVRAEGLDTLGAEQGVHVLAAGSTNLEADGFSVEVGPGVVLSNAWEPSVRAQNPPPARASTAAHFKRGMRYIGLACLTSQSSGRPHHSFTCTNPFRYTVRDWTAALPPPSPPVVRGLPAAADAIWHDGRWYYAKMIYELERNNGVPYSELVELYGALPYNEDNRVLLQSLCGRAARIRDVQLFASAPSLGTVFGTYPPCYYYVEGATLYAQTGSVVSDATCTTGTRRCVLFSEDPFDPDPPPPEVPPAALRTYSSNEYVARDGRPHYVKFVRSSSTYRTLAAAQVTIEGNALDVAQVTAGDYTDVFLQCACGAGIGAPFDPECVGTIYTPWIYAAQRACKAREWGFEAFDVRSCDNFLAAPQTSWSSSGYASCETTSPLGSYTSAGQVWYRQYDWSNDVWGGNDNCVNGCIFFSTAPFASTA